MSQKGLLTSGLCALSLSVSLIAGCASPVTPPPTDAAAPGAAVPGAAAPGGETPAANPGAPVAPAAVTPVTLSGKASFRGEALSGYTVTVLDAQTGQPVTLTNDLNGATGLTVLNQNLVTDANGAFSFQVVGLQAGQALRVQVKKGNAVLETVVTSDLTALGAKKMQLLQASGNGLDINELTTAIAKIARGVILTTRVLKAEEAAPVLAKLAADLSALTAKFEKALKDNPGMANTLVSSEGKEATTVKALVDAAGVAKELTKSIADRVADVAKAAGTGASAAASDPSVQAALAKVEFYGTSLAGTFANSNFTLSNALTGKSVDAASGNLDTVTTTPVSSGGSGSTSTTPSIVPDIVVDTAQELKDAITAAEAGDIIGLGANIDLSDDYLSLNKAVMLYGAGYSINKPISVTAAATLKNITVTPGTIPSSGDSAIYVGATGATLDGVKITGSSILAGYRIQAPVAIRGIVTLADVALTVKNSTITNCTTGIYLNPGTVLTATGNTISGCEAGIGSESADLRNGVSGNTFTGNTEDIGLYRPEVTGTSTSALRTKLMANNTGAIHVNLYGYIANAAALRTALTGSESTLLLDTAFQGDLDAFVIDREGVTIDGNGALLNGGFEIKKPNVTVKNMTIIGQGFLDTTSTDAA